MGQGIQEWTKQDLWKRACKNYHLKFLKAVFQCHLLRKNETWKDFRYQVWEFAQNTSMKIPLHTSMTGLTKYCSNCLVEHSFPFSFLGKKHLFFCSSRHLIVQSQQWKHQQNVWNLLTLQTPERRYSDVFIINFIYRFHTKISHKVSTVSFEQVNAGWDTFDCLLWWYTHKKWKINFIVCINSIGNNAWKWKGVI